MKEELLLLGVDVLGDENKPQQDMHEESSGAGNKQEKPQEYSEALRRLLFYFRNDEKLMERFIEECRSGDYKPREIGSKYKNLGQKVLQRGSPDFIAKRLHGILKRIELVKIWYDTFKITFNTSGLRLAFLLSLAPIFPFSP